MAMRATPDRSRMAPDGPSDVRVTVTVRSRHGGRRPSLRSATALAVVAIAVFAVILAIAQHRAPNGSALHCVSVTVSASNRAYASVNVNHGTGCPRHRGVGATGLLAPDESSNYTDMSDIAKSFPRRPFVTTGT